MGRTPAGRADMSRLSVNEQARTLRFYRETGRQMPTWILRKNIDGERLGEPRQCAGPKDIGRVVGVLTIEEQIAQMLAEHEKAESLVDAESHADATCRIFRGDEVVGYIVVLSTDLP